MPTVASPVSLCLRFLVVNPVGHWHNTEARDSASHADIHQGDCMAKVNRLAAESVAGYNS